MVSSEIERNQISRHFSTFQYEIYETKITTFPVEKWINIKFSLVYLITFKVEGQSPYQKQAARIFIPSDALSIE